MRNLDRCVVQETILGRRPMLCVWRALTRARSLHRTGKPPPRAAIAGSLLAQLFTAGSSHPAAALMLPHDATPDGLTREVSPPPAEVAAAAAAADDESTEPKAKKACV